MPFSIAAVLLLVLSGCSMALLYQAGQLEERDLLPLEVAKEMSRVAENVASDLEEVAYSKAIESVLSVSDINESSIIGRFDQLLANHTRTNYPRGTGAFSIAANATNATLVFMRANIEELYPELEGMGPEYNMTTVPVYFSITGNITVVVTGSRGTVVSSQDLGRGLYVPVPLVANRIDSLANALGGGRCEFENIVRYELSALAQDRVLRGYGIGSMSGFKGTTQILTEEDVLRAVNLALLLEIRPAPKLYGGRCGSSRPLSQLLRQPRIRYRSAALPEPLRHR